MGTSGNTHGERNDARPATKAMPILSCALMQGLSPLITLLAYAQNDTRVSVTCQAILQIRSCSLSAVSLTSSGLFGSMDAGSGGFFCLPGSVPLMQIGSGGHWVSQVDPERLRPLVLRAHSGPVMFEAILELPTSCLI